MIDEESSPVWRVIRRLIVLAIIGAIGYFVGLPLSHWFMTNPHPLLAMLRDHIAKNFPEYMIFFSALAVAVVCTMPALIPKSTQDWWTWMRDAFQTAVPAARARTEQHSQSTVVNASGTSIQEATKTIEPPPVVPLVQPVEPAPTQKQE